MSYERLLAQGSIREHKLTAEEVRVRVEELREAAEQALGDAQVEEQSVDGRYQDAYAAARFLAEVVMTAEGYRPSSRPGQHRTMFEFLAVANSGGWRDEASYFQECRKQRNLVAYERVGAVSLSQVEELISEARAFEASVISWLKEAHPELGLAE
ncbi:MAG: hypothetical protein AB7W28_01120 [Armatimonadota bacterium]